jgi:diadenosine tetraphosphate (Ap4A) HIT family hydrolase
MSDPACPFCAKLARPDLLPDDELVWTFPHSLVLLGPWQFYHGYCLVVSRTHARELGDLPDAERRSYIEEMCLVARAIMKAFAPHKLNYELLGNQVPHPHWHLFARYADDPARLSPVWLALDAAERDESAKRRLQTGPEPRTATVAALRRELISLGAVPG